MKQGGQLYVVSGVSAGWMPVMKKVQAGQRVDKSGQHCYLARIEPGKLYRLSATDINDSDISLGNILLPKYSIDSEGRAFPEMLDDNLYQIDDNAEPDETEPAPRFLKCGINDLSLIGYGYLYTKSGGPDVITIPTGPEPLRGDVNGDNTVDVADISTIIDIMAGKL